MRDLYKMDGSEMYNYVVENGKNIVKNVDDGEGYEIYKCDDKFIVFDFNDIDGKIVRFEKVYDSLNKLLEECIL